MAAYSRQPHTNGARLLLFLAPLLVGRATPLAAQHGHISPKQLTWLVTAARGTALDSGALRDVVARSGHAAPGKLVQVLIVPGVAHFPCGPMGRECYGLWVQLAGADAVFLAEQAPRFATVYRHELLHYILQDGDHPALFQALRLDEVD